MITFEYLPYCKEVNNTPDYSPQSSALDVKQTNPSSQQPPPKSAMFLPTTTLLALAASLVPSALAIPTNINLILIDRAYHLPTKVTHTLTYCATAQLCNTITITHQGFCTTLDKGYQLLTFSPGIECDVYLLGSCFKQPFVHADKRGKVVGSFDAATDEYAIKYGVGSVRSFECFEV